MIIEKMQYKKLGQFIKNKRLMVGASLNRFAIENEIEPAILSRIENLKQDIKIGILVKIANGFKVTPAQLLQEFENKNKIH